MSEGKGNKKNLIKDVIKDYVDKYFIYQDLENKLKFMDHAEDTLELKNKRDQAKAALKEVVENYNKLQANHKNNYSNN